MEAMLIAKAIGSVAPLVASAIGDAVNAGDYAKARELAQQAAQKYKDIIPPQLQEQVARQQGATELKGAAENLDTRTRDAQMRALDQLGQISETGMTGADMASYAQARDQASQMAAAGQQGALQRAAQQGLGEQTEYTAALLGNQGASNRSAQLGGQVAQDSAARRMRALEAMGSLGGNIRGQDWDIASRVGGAQDLINNFNTSLASKADQYNLGLPQQRFANQMAAADAYNKGYGIESGALNNDINRRNKQAAYYGSQVSNLANTAGSAMGDAGGGDELSTWLQKRKGGGS